MPVSDDRTPLRIMFNPGRHSYHETVHPNSAGAPGCEDEDQGWYPACSFPPQGTLVTKDALYMQKHNWGGEQKSTKPETQRRISLFLKYCFFFSEMEENCQRSLQNFKAQEIGNRNLRKPVLEFKGATRSPWQKNGIK